MVASDLAAFSANQVALRFVEQYYPILQNHPHDAHGFYNDNSSMELVDGGITKSASSCHEIHNLIMSLEVSATEIKKVSAFESCNGGVFMVVLGLFKSENFSRRTKFVHSLFLSPQAQGYFVLNDVLHLLDEEATSQFEGVSEPLIPVVAKATQIFMSEVVYEPPTLLIAVVRAKQAFERAESDTLTPVLTKTDVSDVSKPLTPVIAEDAAADGTKHDESDGIFDPLTPVVVKANEVFVSEESKVVSEPLLVAEDEVHAQPTASTPHHAQPVHPVEEKVKTCVESYHITAADDAIENQGFNEHPQESDHIVGNNIIENHSFEDHPQVDSSSNENIMIENVQDSINETPPLKEETVGETSKPSYASILKGARGQLNQPTKVVQSVIIPRQHLQQTSLVSHTIGDIKFESLSNREGHSKSIYVRNLPSVVNTLEVLQEFRKFGKVKIDGVHIIKNFGVCNAFVEFEDCQGAQNAIKASPIKLAANGRQVYIEMKRSNSNNGGGGTSKGRRWQSERSGGSR